VASRSANDLKNAVCPRATPHDQMRAQMMVDRICQYIAEGRLARLEAAAAA
jgi:hypothetical protein